MNRQDMRTENTNPQIRRTAPSNPPTQPGRKKPDPALLSLLRGCMLVLGGMIFIVGMLLLVLPMFRVKNIEVVGNNYYTVEEIIQSSGVAVDDELLTVDRNTVAKSLFQNCTYVRTADVDRVFPSTVRITIEERANVMYTAYEDNYYAIDQNFQVLAESANEADFASFLKVELPEIASLSVGNKVVFRNTETDLGYIKELIEALEKENVLPSVTSLDFSKKYSVSYVMGNTCRVELGKVGDMDVKLELVGRILELKGGTEGICSVVDVSNLQKPTYRAVSAAEVLQS